MGKQSGDKVQVNEYRMSIHFGICTGPVDLISGIYIGEKEAWAGKLEQTGVIGIDQGELFGGPKKEGGAVGSVTYLMGDDDQLVPNYLAGKYGKTTDTMPAYRGIASAFFHEAIEGVGSAPNSSLPSPLAFVSIAANWVMSAIAQGRTGFYWSANNPYMRSVWVKVGRAAIGLDTRYAKLPRGDNDFDCNPAHIIFESLTNTSWGMGSPSSSIDMASFESAAYALFNENFGLSMIWTKQSTIEDFISEVLDHIEATLFLNPRTGLLTLKLIRGDYDVDSLRVFTPDNSVVTNFSRKHWGETVNEIVVTWTNPDNEGEETVTVQDLANIAMQGAPISDSRNYYGVRTSTLATILAQRDLRASSYPLASCDIETDRSGWDLLPGSVVKLHSPEDGIENMVMRVGPVDYGEPGQKTIRASLVEDVFSFAASEYTVPPTTEHEDPSEDPAPAAFTYAFTLPYYFVVNEVNPIASADAEYPTVFSGVLAAQTGIDTATFELYGSMVDPVGNVTQGSLGTKTIAAHAELEDDIPAEVFTIIPGFPGRTQGSAPRAGGFVIFGDGAEHEVEIAAISFVDGSGYKLNRGVLDTIPRAWPSGTPVWFVDADVTFADSDQRAAFEEVSYKILTRTSKGLLAQGSAPVETVTLTERPWLPTRPANVWMAGQAFQAVDASADYDLYLSWSNRNRLTENSQVLPFWEDPITPEVDQYTRVEIRTLGGDLLIGLSGLTGGDVAIPFDLFGGETSAKVSVKAERGKVFGQYGSEGLMSLQYIENVVTPGDVHAVTYGSVETVESARTFTVYDPHLAGYTTGQLNGRYILWDWQDGEYEGWDWDEISAAMAAHYGDDWTLQEIPDDLSILGLDPSETLENSNTVARIVTFTNEAGVQRITIDRDPPTPISNADDFRII